MSGACVGMGCLRRWDAGVTWYLTVPNSVIAPVSANGEVCFYVYGTAHLLADVSGVFF